MTHQPDPSTDGRTFSVIVCTYSLERWDLLMEALRSLCRQDRPVEEILVVVDHNEPMLAKIRKEVPFAKVVPNDRKRGLSGGRNAGVAAASGDIVAWLDDDAEAAADWSARLMQDFADPNVVGVGSWVEPRWELSKPGWFPEEFYWVVGCSYRGMPTSKEPIRNPFGGAMAIRRDILQSVGEFREELGRGFADTPLGCEETELCVRVHQQFPELYFVQDSWARVLHFVPDKRTRWKYFRARCFAEGVSKAWLSRTVGYSDGLSTERSYVWRVLPAGVLRNLGVELWSDPWALPRAAAIVAGLVITSAGFVAGKVSGPKQETEGTQAVESADASSPEPVAVAGQRDVEQLTGERAGG